MISAIDVVLIFGLIVLACGSAGLLIVRLSNPMLRGIGWLGGAFAAGGCGAALVLFDSSIGPLFGVALADLLVLLAFVLLHVAILELTDSRSMVPTFGVGLLALQAIVDLYLISGHDSGRVRVTVIGLLIAAQAAQTAVRLFRERQPDVRIPARFTGSILFGFMLFNLLRSTVVGFALLGGAQSEHLLEAFAFSLFIAVALGIAFGLFWMTTTTLSAGLERMASTDPLTRIYNRRVFLLWCEKELVRSQRGASAFSVLMVDMDHFKKINDNFGHRTGDAALCAAVERMQDSIRGIDVLGRWGGEEFCALLPNASAEAALVVAERLRSNVEQIRLPNTQSWNDDNIRTVRLTVSVGVATYMGAGDTVQSMLHRADESLYKAKAAGRNRVLAMPAAIASAGQWLPNESVPAAKAS